MLVSAVVLLVFTVHTTVMVSFMLGDNPKDPLIYVQSTPDVTMVQKKIDNLSQRLTSGKDLVVYYDDETSWPYSWYLRDYTKAVYQPKGPTTPPDVPGGAGGPGERRQGAAADGQVHAHAAEDALLVPRG